MKPDYKYAAKVDRVVDGDTVDAVMDLGFSVAIKIRCRLARINALEMNEAGGKDAKLIVQTLLPVGKDVFIHSTQLDKYGRSIAEIYVNNENLTDVLRDSHPELFKPYP